MADLWFGNNATKLSAAAHKWLGRNRPLTGAGATADVGATQRDSGSSQETVGQPGLLRDHPVASFNPHIIAGVTTDVFGAPGSHAPAHGRFVGLGGV